MAPVKKPARKPAPSPTPSPASGPDAAPAAIAKTLGRKPSRKVAREMLVLETRRLRALFAEIAERYVSEMEARIAAAAQAIETRDVPHGKIEAMLKVVRGLNVKPQKGRRKDLARIEKATETLFKTLEE